MRASGRETRFVGTDRLQKRAELVIELGQDWSEVVVIVEREIARAKLGEKVVSDPARETRAE